MPLTAEEKNQIAQGGIAFGTQALATSAGFSVAGTAGLGIIALPLVLGLQAQFSRVHAPKINPISILNQARALQRRGLDPRISSDPFFGDTIISARDQDRFLPELVRGVAERRVRSTQDFSSILARREAITEGLAASAMERGFAATIDPDLRGGVFRETAESPLKFIEGDFL